MKESMKFNYLQSKKNREYFRFRFYENIGSMIIGAANRSKRNIVRIQNMQNKLREAAGS